jgi:two-component SAPR family response regulator
MFYSGEIENDTLLSSYRMHIFEGLKFKYIYNIKRRFLRRIQNINTNYKYKKKHIKTYKDAFLDELRTSK